MLRDPVPSFQSNVCIMGVAVSPGFVILFEKVSDQIAHAIKRPYVWLIMFQKHMPNSSL